MTNNILSADDYAHFTDEQIKETAAELGIKSPGRFSREKTIQKIVDAVVEAEKSLNQIQQPEIEEKQANNDIYEVTEYVAPEIKKVVVAHPDSYELAIKHIREHFDTLYNNRQIPVDLDSLLVIGKPAQTKGAGINSIVVRLISNAHASTEISLVQPMRDIVNQVKEFFFIAYSQQTKRSLNLA